MGSTSVSAQWCSGRGGCSCDCGWASSATCGHDDGSCCFGCCCGSSPGPSPPGPPSPAGGGAKYCPNPASDFAADYGSPKWSSSGWTIHGGARASSKASYNLAGGFVEFDMDLGGAHGGVNNNFYITFPNSVGNYCDSGGTGGCAELDFVENTGNCAAATTFHTDPGGGDKGGTQTVNGISSHVHVRAEWDGSGDQLAVHVDGHAISGPGNVGGEMTSRGAVLYSSQWTGWVPGSCGGDGNLGASTFSVSNLKIEGKVIQGPEPKRCATAAPTPSPTPPPTPAPITPSPTPGPTPAGPTPAPVPSGCPCGTMASCLALCPGDEKGYKACAAECDARCERSVVV